MGKYQHLQKDNRCAVCNQRFWSPVQALQHRRYHPVVVKEKGR